MRVNTIAITSIKLPFKHPTTVLIAGPTGCGKTQFLLQVIQNRAIQPPPKRIVCVYGEWQPAYDKIKQIGTKLHDQVQFVRNPDSEQLAQLYSTFKPGLRTTLLIIDDQMAYGRIRKDGGRGLTSDQCAKFVQPATRNAKCQFELALPGIVKKYPRQEKRHKFAR